MSEDKIQRTPCDSIDASLFLVVFYKNEKSVFDAIPSKTSFLAGFLVFGIMAFATIGFILLLVGGMDLSKLSFFGCRSGSPFRR